MFKQPPWDLSPPRSEPLADHAVPARSDHLRGRRVALLVCGGIAAMKAPLVARALRRRGAEVTAFVSEEAGRYVGLDALSWSCDRAAITALSARAEHLGGGAPFDAYLVAPATYNTLNKLAAGVADTLLTAVLSSALGRRERGEAALLVAPTLHGSMHTSILTESLRRLRALGVEVLAPRDDYGKHNLPAEEALALAVSRAVSASPLRGRGVLVTGGPTPVAVDGVRRMTNKFTGALALHIAEDLAWAGADVRLLLGGAALAPPEELLPFTERVALYDDYRARCLALAAHPDCAAGVFSAAVADYTPTAVNGAPVGGGKLPSGQGRLVVELAPTAKVIDEVRALRPDLEVVSFKYQEGVTHEALMEIGRARAERFGAAVANRGEEVGAGGAQVAWLLTREGAAAGAPPTRAEGKRGIARLVRDRLEARLGADGR
ncbi:MAG: phosphopantothenoylcysteine decarboxylase [Deltaproteobacteria bacterium]|nr:phosphopantothenoylcysteine decarboxylase [Deltaproteobacteria bacterium]